MQWDKTGNAGFSKTKPWLRIDKNYQLINVAEQKKDPGSLISLYRKLAELRNRESALNAGQYTPVYSDSQVISYIRQTPGQARFLIVLNGGYKPPCLSVLEAATGRELRRVPVADACATARQRERKPTTPIFFAKFASLAR